jgi:Subtilase family
MATLRDGRRRPGEIVFACLLGAWVVGVTAVLQVVAWAVEQFLIIEGLAMPAWAWPVACWLNAVLIGAPAVVLFAVAHRTTARATGYVWSLAALALGVLGSIRAIPSQQSEIYFAVLALVAGLLGLLVTRLPLLRTAMVMPRRYAADYRPPGSTRSSVPAGLAVGIAILVPWLWVGALGGPLETVLAVAAAGAVGWLGAVLLRPLWAAFHAQDPSQRRFGRWALTGLIAGTALVPFAAGVGASGPHLTEMLVLPALGFVAAALAAYSRRSTPAVAALLGVAALGPLAFVEAEETTIALGLHDVGFWMAVGAACSFVVATLAAGISSVVSAPRAGRTPSALSRIAAPIALAAVTATAIAVYPLAGHPGFFGERLFVVMKQQADLAGLDRIADRDDRLRQTYDRLTTTADTTQAALRATLHRDGIAFTPYYLVNGIEVDGDAATRVWLSRRADVDRVLLNPRLRPIPSAGGPMTGDQPAPTGPEWNIQLIGADQVWATGDTGSGIVIGGSDTGVDLAHPAVHQQYRGGDDSWYDPWNHTRSPVDHNGHGTHTIGSALGTGGIGVAPGAQWMACVNLDRDMGNPAYYLDCMQFMLAPFPYGGNPFTDGDPTRAADILTNSWGCPTLEGCDLDALRPAVDALSAAGIFFVAAAGNEGPRCGSIDDAPAPYAATFTVGAVDQNRRVASFSSRGPVAGLTKPDVVAPGVGVVSALPGGGYGALDGTSMATPQVAGVVALMWSASPALRGNIARTAEILRDTATPAADSSETLGAACPGADQTGAGLVNAPAAVAEARTVK